ncbi:hypothetical protein EBT31_04950 [bacterium]|nr:hypothetical protein [bacterium]NBX49034.1 hypothetical protein [bacterium]
MAIELSERAKVALRLTLFLGTTLLVGFALYWFFFAQPPSLIEEGSPAEEGAGGGSLPGSTTGGPRTGTGANDDDGPGTLPVSQVAEGGETITTQLTTSAVTSPQVNADGTVAYYDPADGRFYTIDSKGNVQALSLTQFPDAETVVFNDAASAAVIEFPDGSNVVYNFETAKQVTLPNHWESFSFSADGTEIVSKSIGADPSNRALVISAADGSSTQVIAALGSNDDLVTVSWSPASSIVGFSATGEGTSTFGQRKVYTIGEDGEAAGVITVNGTNYQNIWSPSGKYILYSIAEAGDDYRPSLWYVDAKGDRHGDLRLRLGLKTTVDRCTFGNETTLYCGVPVTAIAGSGSNPEILKGPDHLYKISLPSGDAELLAIPTVSTAIKNVSVNTDESILYYTDSRGKLNMIRLK